jgi:serine/threonine protein kinase
MSLEPGQVVENKYRIVRLLGEGGMGAVYEGENVAIQRRVAIKVVRRIKRYTEAAEIEAGILSDVNLADSVGEQPVVRLLGRFEWRGHFCMVMEPLGESLFDYVKANDYRPLPLYCVQSFADQLVRAVAFLHELRLVHTDLKLENILLVSREGFQSVEKPTSQRDKLRGRLVLAPVGGTAIKLIDFGGATFDFEAKSSLINTRQYRAPEVILGLGWGTPSDVWSLGW